MTIEELKYTVVIPAYKASEELKKTLPKLLEMINPDTILVVNDGITDDTESVCKQFSVKCISHPSNRGKGAALSTAFYELKESCDWIITLDADGQHRPQDISRFIDKAKGADDRCAIIYGARSFGLKEMPFARIISNTLTSGFLSILCKDKILDSQSGFRAYRSKALSNISCRYKRFEMESEILIRLSKNGWTTDSIDIPTIYPEDGTSHISHLKDTLRWIHAVFSTFLTVKKEIIAQ